MAALSFVSSSTAQRDSGITRKVIVWAMFCALLSALVLSMFAGNAHAKKRKPKPLSSAADLRYGAALYHYYEGDYLSALSELLVAESRDGIQGHGDNPKIMEGGFALAYGMERHASGIFEALLEKNRPQKVRDAAWFYLAKIRYDNNNWESAQAAIDKVGSDPEPALKEEIDALRVNIMIRQDRLEDAGVFLSNTPLNSEWQPYINFNLGSAWTRRENYNAAIRYYNLLGAEYFSTDEHRALFDKAMTAAGYLYLLEEEYRLAIRRFTKVRLNSALSNRALLGYGWAASELGDYQEALKPWQHLADSSFVDENSQEALLAVPFAYERLNANSLALENYQLAEKKYTLELKKLDDVIDSLQGERFFKTLEIEKSKGIDWLNYARENQLSPRVAYLTKLFSKNEFQGAVQDIRDLLAIKDRMTQWQDKLELYDGMLVERAKNRLRDSKYLDDPELLSRVKVMTKLRAGHASRVQRAIAKQDYLAFANDSEKEMQERLIRAEKNIELLRETDPFIDEYEESIRRYQGLLTWQISETFSARSWDATKEIKVLDDSLNDMKQSFIRARKIMAGTPDIDAYHQRIINANTRIQNGQLAIDTKIDELQFKLSEQLVSVLKVQRIRLFDYLAQSRLAIARIYDKVNNSTSARQNEESIGSNEESIDSNADEGEQ